MFTEAQVFRAVVEEMAEQGHPAAIRALIQVDGHSPYLQQIRGLWEAQNVYGHHRQPTRSERRLEELAEPVDPDYERRARAELAWRLREAWRTIWAELGAPITIVRLQGAGGNGKDRRAA